MFDHLYPGSNKLLNKNCIVTSGDSGMGRTVAIALAEESAEMGHHLFKRRRGRPILMKRAGQPVEIAGAYIFLSSHASQHITRHFSHPNGGEIING